MARTAAYDRAEVLGKARDLFWAKGYHATSLRDLEAALDMRPGSIYAAFGSKEKLFAETLRLYSEVADEEFERTVSAHGSPLEGLAAYARGFGGLCERDVPSRACMLVKTIMELPEDDPVLRQTAEGLMRRVEAGFAERFRLAQEIGELAAEEDPGRLARRFQAAMFGLRAYAQRTDAGDGVRDLAEDIAAGIEALRVG